jgi:23S rRNA pseudouridine2605 synthase
LVRISKFLSQCGVTSRRGAEALIKDGRVTVNNQIPEKVGTIIDEATDVIRVDGVAVSPVNEKVYIILNKPKKTLTSLHDPFKRRTVTKFLRGLKHRVYPVGRLDYDTEGVLLLTNDGELAYRLAHPKYGVKKVYEALVTGEFKRDSSLVISRGVKLEDGKTGKAVVDILGYTRSKMTRIRLTLTEGRKREVKQLCKAVGHPVKALRRVEFADITARNVKPGAWRKLSVGEVNHLKEMVGLVGE